MWFWFNKIGAILFLLIQDYFLLDLGYKWAEQLNAKTDTNWAQFLMLGYSIGLTVVDITVLVLCFVKFRCAGLALTVLSVVTVLCIFWHLSAYMRLCNVHVFRDNWNPFVAGTTVTYIVYLTWSFLASWSQDPVNKKGTTGPFVLAPDSCYYKQGETYSIMLQVFVGLTFTTVTIMSLATAARKDSPQGAEVKADKTSAVGDILAEKVDGDAKAENAEEEQENIFPVTVQSILFQVILMCATFYFGMLFTNWGDPYLIDGESPSYDAEVWYYSPRFTTWVKFINLCIACILLTVSMMLEVCCPNRIL